MAVPVLVIAALSLTISVAQPGTPKAEAASQWCSESGDSCESTFRLRGVRYVERRYAERYVRRDKLCVTAPTGRTDCSAGRLRRRGSIWALRLRWSRHFPDRGSGVYTFVTGAPTADAVTFRIR